MASIQHFMQNLHTTSHILTTSFFQVSKSFGCKPTSGEKRMVVVYELFGNLPVLLLCMHNRVETFSKKKCITKTPNFIHLTFHFVSKLISSSIMVEVLSLRFFPKWIYVDEDNITYDDVS